MLVLFEGDVLNLLSSPNVDTLREIEQELNADPRYFSVVSPLTVVQLGAEQAKVQQAATVAQLAQQQEQAAAAARQQVAAAGGSAQAQEEAAQAARDAALKDLLAKQGPDAQRFAQLGDLSPDNLKVAEFVLFDAQGNVRPEMADIVPDREHSLMVVRPAGNMSIDEQAKAAGDISKLIRSHSFQGLSVLPSGPAILIKEINNSMRANLIKMAVLATADDGRRPGAGLPGALAAPIAARGPRRLRVGFRPHGLSLPAPDDGHHLRSADPDRPGRGFRYPVP